MKGLVLTAIFISTISIAFADITACIPPESQNVETEKNHLSLKANESFFIEHIPLDFSHPAFSFKGYLDNVTIDQLLEFQFCFWELFHKSNLINITFPEILLRGDKYNLTGDIGDLFDIFGTGPFNMSLTKFSIALTHYNKNVTENATCYTWNVDLDLIELKVHFENFMDDQELGDLINKLIGELGPEIVTTLWGEFKEAIEPILQKIIDELLGSEEILKANRNNQLSAYLVCIDSDKILHNV